ncbi:MAG: IS1595 family transposase [Vulcanimicrobiaceae bacterium]
MHDGQERNPASARHEPAGFLERYGTEVQCREALMRIRWPGGLICPHRGHAGHCQLRGRPVLQCNRCKHQASLTAGSLFARSHLPLRTLFLAIDLLTQHAQRKSPRDKLMQTMIERDDAKPLAGIVQLDDAYWGGERHGGATGRDRPGKTPFVAAVQITAHGFPLAMRMDVVPGFRKPALAQWAKRHLAPGTAVVPWGLPLVVSDGLNCFPGVTAADCTHVPLVREKLQPYCLHSISNGKVEGVTDRPYGAIPGSP